MLRINVVAPIMLLSGFCSSLRKKKISWIVNISSIWAIVAKEKRLQYAVTKHGINGVTRTLAVELGHNNILVNSVCPGYVLTEMTRKNVAAADKKAIESFIPLKRMAQPSEVAEVVYFLASPQNTYLTGQIITVDGGYTAK
jgi:3-oxoacyl-[acyl-carrier protein] reductase